VFTHYSYSTAYSILLLGRVPPIGGALRVLILPTGAENPSYVGLKAVTRGVFWVFEHPAKFQGKIRHTKIDLLLVTKFARGVEPTVSRFVVKTVFMPSTSLEMHQNRFRPGLRPGPHWGSLQHSLRPLAGGDRGGSPRSPQEPYALLGPSGFGHTGYAVSSPNTPENKS